MNKKTFKTEKVLAAYHMLGGAKYGKLSDDDKIKVFKICIALKPTATKYDEASKEAEMKLKPDGYDERLEKAREYDRCRRDKDADASHLAMGPEEFNDFMREVNHYQELVTKALEDEKNKEVEVEFEPIGEDALLKLMNSNDWTMAEVMAVSEVAVE